MKKIHQIVACLLSVILLFSAGCSSSTRQPEKPTEGAETVPAETTGPNFRDTSLAALRRAMSGTTQLFAVAYFGCPDIIDPDIHLDPYTVMQEQAPQLCEELPFLLDIPADRVIGTNGDLFCIVPLDEDATVAVSKSVWDETAQQYIYLDPVYHGESGEPVLLFCNGDGWEPDTQVFISGPSGKVMWYPRIDSSKCVMPLRNDDWDDLFLDFSAYREMLVKRNRDMKDGWVIPTADMLYGSTWCWDGFLEDGRDVRYQVRFEEEILSVRWNDGMDEEDHVYPDARWELIHEDGFAVLSIDFREMAGVLRYNLKYNEAFELLYVGMDATQEEILTGWEPLYRYLMPPEAPEPVEMLGKWELAWSEVEGDRNEAEPGTCTIEIQISASSGFLMSYTSREFPHHNFENELLTFDERELHYNCGNDAWVADLDYVGPYGTTYAVTLTVEGILIKQNYSLVDGAPMVSYEYFIRGSE